MDKTIRHFEALQKRYRTQHDGDICPHVMRALDALRKVDELTSALAAMTAERDAAKRYLADKITLNRVMGEAFKVTAEERDEYKRRAEAAERDLNKMIDEADYPFCSNFCKNTALCRAGCKPEWRGPEPKEGA